MKKAAFKGSETNPITFSDDNTDQYRSFLLTTNLSYSYIPEMDYDIFVRQLKSNQDLDFSSNEDANFRCSSGWENRYPTFFVRLAVSDQGDDSEDVNLPPRFYVNEISSGVC